MGEFGGVGGWVWVWGRAGDGLEGEEESSEEEGCGWEEVDEMHLLSGLFFFGFVLRCFWEEGETEKSGCWLREWGKGNEERKDGEDID